MTRISSLFIATTLAILPVSAFAQTATAPAKDAAPTGIMSTAPATPAPGKSTDKTTANVIQSAKPDVKAATPGAKTEVHSMNTVNPHHAKTPVPGKTAEPSKS